MMADQERTGTDESTGVTGPQTPRNPEADKIEEGTEQKGGGADAAVPQGWEADEEGKEKSS
jgi:hypothetical protein